MSSQERRVALIGAGAAGRLFLREIKAHRRKLGYCPIVFLDDNTALAGKDIDGIPIECPISKLPEVAERYDIDKVLITMPSASGEVIRKIVHQCRATNLSYLVVPPVYSNLQISGIGRPRKVSVEDILNVGHKQLIDKITIQNLSSQIVLVTGAAGSIGSELVNQIASVPPSLIVALDISESGLYSLKCDIDRKYPDAALEVILCDIRNNKKLDSVISQYKPTLVFHTAAYKHVPMLELFPEEAINTNIIGTLNLLEACKLGVTQRIVAISTDKAVEPCSIMGKTKKIMETLTKCFSTKQEEIMVVRFGNVLESTGSVIPLFRKQIAEGGPITVTHPEVERFFMTTSEAAQLVIQAALLGQGGKTYVLNMGKPHKIIDIARDLIRLSGLEEGRDIEIVLTGLRPGEKLCEKLFSDAEKKRLVFNSLIYEVTNAKINDCEKIMKNIRYLVENHITAPREKIVEVLQRTLDLIE